ncbi:MAG: type II toxin-antitoxin system VapB family antitoxin [Magnetococcales bacterium]|nr:type II toxin-antitoxin system VapB family antitoxin [Magnetococcales bacterium]
MITLDNRETCDLANHLAHMTGEGMSQAITRAIEERLARIEQTNRLAEELLAIGRACASQMQEPYLSVEHGDLLYDEKGVPQ